MYLWLLSWSLEGSAGIMKIMSTLPLWCIFGYSRGGWKVVMES